MAWTTPLTAVSNAVYTAAQHNALRDNLLMTAPALATTAGGHFAATGTNAIAQRVSQVAGVNTAQTTTNTSYTNLTTVGPQITATTGPAALIFMSSRVSNATAGQNSWVSYNITGASAISPSDNYALSYDSPVVNSTMYATYATLETGLTAGSNIFTMQYRVSSSTGTFSNRRLAVFPL